MKTSYGNESSRPSVDSMMTPMIDVVFLLLIFFLTTSSFQKLEKQLPSASATSPETAKSGSTNQSSTAEPTDLSDLVIKISQRAGKPRYFLQNEDIDSLEQIASRLNSILKVRNDVPIIIDPEDSVPAGEAIRVYDLVRANGSISVFLVAR